MDCEELGAFVAHGFSARTARKLGLPGLAQELSDGAVATVSHTESGVSVCVLEEWGDGSFVPLVELRFACVRDAWEALSTSRWGAGERFVVDSEER